MILSVDVITGFELTDTELIRALSPSHGVIVYNHTLKLLREDGHKPYEVSTWYNPQTMSTNVRIQSTKLEKWG